MGNIKLGSYLFWREEPKQNGHEVHKGGKRAQFFQFFPSCPLCLKIFPVQNRELYFLNNDRASLAIVAFAPIQNVYNGGQAKIVYSDGRPNVVLTSYAYILKWGP